MVRNRPACVHTGWTFRQPHGSEGPLCQKPRPTCTRATAFLAHGCLPRVGSLSSVGNHVPRVHAGRRSLHRTASLSIRTSVLQATTTTTGNRLAKNGTGGPPSGQAGPWIPFSGFFPTERPFRGFCASAIVPLAANSRCVHFRLASAAAATRRHRVIPAGYSSFLQPWQLPPEVSTHIGRQLPSALGRGPNCQKAPEVSAHIRLPLPREPGDSHFPS